MDYNIINVPVKDKNMTKEEKNMAKKDENIISNDIKKQKIIAKKKLIYTKDNIKIEKYECYDYDYIVHISDIHIHRNPDRHKEFRTVFQNFYDRLDRMLEEGKKFIIAVLGDLVHEKTVLSTENNDLAKEFLHEITKRALTIVITGNHDMYENAPNRLDAISSLLSYSSIKNIYYFRESGLYELGPLIFCVSSLIDKKFLTYQSIEHLIPDKSKKVVALYHGMIVGMRTHDKYEIEAASIRTEEFIGTTRRRNKQDFDNFDAVLLGDIHKYGYPDQKNYPKMVYCSSLVQISRGESIKDHGYLLWSVKDLSHEFHRVENPNALVNIHIKEKKIISDILEFPKNINCKIFSDYISLSESRKIVEQELGKIHNIINIEGPVIEDYGDGTSHNVDISEKVNENIPEIIKSHLDYSKLSSYYDQIQEAHDIYAKEDNEEVKEEKKKYIWRPLYMNFRNFQSYCDNGKEKIYHEIYFDRGVTEITGMNKNGKSSIMNILLFIIFGSIPNQTQYLINNRYNEGVGELRFEFGNKIYEIHRSMKRSSNTKKCSPDELNFFQILEDGTKKELNENRTDLHLKSFMGMDKNEFISSNIISTKYVTDNFITMTNGKRAELLKKMFKTDIYDTYYKKNSEKLKIIRDEISKYEQDKTYLELNINEINERINSYSNNESNNTKILKKEIKELTNKLDKINNLIKEKREKIQEYEKERNKLYIGLKSVSPTDDRNELEEKLQEIREEINYYLNYYLGTDNYDGIIEKMLKLGEKGIMQMTKNREEIEKKKSYKMNELNEVQYKLKANGIKDVPNISNINEDEILDEDDLIGLESEIEEIKNERTNVKESKETIEIEISNYTEQLKNYNKPQIDLVNCQQQYKKIEGELKINKHKINELNKKLLGYKDQDGANIPYTGDKTQDELENDIKPLISVGKKRPIDNNEQKKVDLELDELNKKVGIKDLDIKIQDYETKYKELEKKKGYYQVPEKYMDSLIIFLSDIKNSGYNKEVLDKIRELEKRKQEIINDIEHNKNLDDIKKENMKIKEENQKIEGYIKYLKKTQIDKKIKELELERINLKEENKRIHLDIEYYELIGLLKEKNRILDEICENKRIDQIIKEKKDKINRQLTIKYNKILNEIRNEIGNELNEIDDILKILYLNKEKQRIKKVLLDIESNEEMMRKMQEINIEKGKLEEMVSNYQNGYHEFLLERERKENILRILEHDLDLLKQKNRELKELEKKCEEKNEKKKVHDIYNDLFKPTNIPLKLVKNNLKLLEKTVNELVEKYTKYCIILNIDSENKKINLKIVERGTNYAPIDQLSGFEKILFNIAIKRSLSENSCLSQCSTIFIDESMDCLDKENFKTALPKIMDFIQHNYESVILISQKSVEHVSDRTILVKYDEKLGSRLIKKR